MRPSLPSLLGLPWAHKLVYRNLCLVTGCIFIWKELYLGTEEMWLFQSQAGLALLWICGPLPRSWDQATARRQERVLLQPSDMVCR